MVRSDKSREFWSSTCPVRRRFKVFVGLVEKLHGVSLPFPHFGADLDSSSFKQYCSALLERRKHPWDVALRPLSLNSRFGISMSLFLFRKLIPGEPPDVLALWERLTSPSSEPSSAFLEFLRIEVPKLFPRGWDRGYVSHCLNSVVPTKSYSERTKLAPSSRDWFLRNTGCGLWSAQQSFVEVVLASVDPPLGLGVPSRMVVVPASGKYRALSIPPVRMNYLRPLHKTLYDYMSRFSWLLRGDAKPARFKGFHRVPGELFCSGDYESATDNLSHPVQLELLRLVLQQCEHVPNGIIVSAMRSFSLNLTVNGGSETLGAPRRQQSGQLMGNLLSFPLLCLVNYLTFRYLTMDRSLPVRINGDDIVFRAKPSVIDRWMEGVKISGLTLSRGKTLVDPGFFTLNSTPFKGLSGSDRHGRSCKLIPFVRSKALFGTGEDDTVSSLSGRFHSFVSGYSPRLRVKARVVFFKENSGWVKSSCRSITAGLGIPVEREVLLESGLYARELRYLEFGHEKPLPNLRSEFGHMPEGYHLRWVDRDTKKSRDADRGLVAAFVAAAWKPRLDGLIGGRRVDFRGDAPDLSDKMILRRSSYVNKVYRLLGAVCTDRLRNARRWISTRWSRVDSSAWDRRPRRVRFPCWFSDEEVKPLLGFSSLEGNHFAVDPLPVRTGPEDSVSAESSCINLCPDQRKYGRVRPPADYTPYVLEDEDD